jgi:tRNA (cytidine/uridine-2'-O-)-methyltransferase
MRLVLFEPDIAQNAGSLLRLGACLGVAVDIVEPCGFVFSGPQMRRAGRRSWRSMARGGSCC